jgi:polyisoprenoid-binding protein YceI
MRRAAAALALCLAVCACDKKDEAAGSSGPSQAPAASSVVDPTVASWHFAIDAKGVTHIDMPGGKEHILADTSAAGGTFDVVPHDLAKSRGVVRVDLATLTTHTFGNDDDASQTRHARTWLEAVVDGKTNEQMRWAELAIRSVDGLSATDIGKVTPKTVGGEDLRELTATLHGDLQIHGHTVPKDAVVDVTFRYPSGAPADSKPTRLDIKSKQPLHVVLKEHDVHPRDPAGKALAWTTSLLSKVAETADVTVELGAAPAP